MHMQYSGTVRGSASIFYFFIFIFFLEKEW